jgi:spectinomycin phosphotransferase
MGGPPGLAEEAIRRALRAGFGVEAGALVLLPVGNDADSWAYRVEVANGPGRFLKVRAGADPARGALVPAHLQRAGVPNVLAPLATGAGEPYVALGRFALALYPLLEARVGAEVGLSPAQWRRLGAALRQVHGVRLPPPLARLVGREPVRPTRRELLADLERLVAAAGPDDPVAAELAGCWRAHRQVIAALVERADRLGRELAGQPYRPVLCHADLHTWNVLVDADGQPWMVDWDEAILAPAERDLMFVVGGIGHGLVRPADTDRFFQGYGPASLDPRRLAYYRCAWAVQDIAAYAEQALLAPEADQASRRAAVAGFVDLFAPGNIVALAQSP